MHRSPTLGRVKEKLDQFSNDIRRQRLQSLDVVIVEIRDLLFEALGEGKFQDDVNATVIRAELIEMIHYIIGAIVSLRGSKSELGFEIVTRFQFIYHFLLDNRQLPDRREHRLATAGEKDLPHLTIAPLMREIRAMVQSVTQSTGNDTAQYVELLFVHGRIEQVIAQYSRIFFHKNEERIPLKREVDEDEETYNRRRKEAEVEDEDEECITDRAFLGLFRKLSIIHNKIQEKLGRMVGSYEQEHIAPLIDYYRRVIDMLTIISKEYERGIGYADLIDRVTSESVG